MATPVWPYGVFAEKHAHDKRGHGTQLISSPFSLYQRPRVKTIHRRSGAARKKSAPNEEERQMAADESGWANSEE